MQTQSACFVTDKLLKKKTDIDILLQNKHFENTQLNVTVNAASLTSHEA